MGGNWQVTSFAGADNVELGGFLVFGTRPIYERIERQSGVRFVVPDYPAQHSYRGRRYPFGSLWLRAVRLLEVNRKPLTLLRAGRFIAAHGRRLMNHGYEIRYPERGVASILDRYGALQKELGLDIRLNTRIVDVYAGSKRPTPTSSTSRTNGPLP